MEGEGSTQAAEAVLESLRTRGWCIGDIDQVKALVVIHTALSDDGDTCSVADSIESELLNMDLKSIGAKSLPDSNLLRKTPYLQGPKVLQISSVRDISVSSIGEFSDSSSRRLLRFILTDGHSEITAVEYSHIPLIPKDVVPGAKVRLENKAPVHSGILCLNPKVVTLIGGVVQPLYEEWQMIQKYSGISRSSMRLSQETDSGGPPPFEKLQIAASFSRSSQQVKPSDNIASTSKSSVPPAANTQFRLPDMQQRGNSSDDKERTKSLIKERIGEEPRLIEGAVAQSGRVRYQAIAQMHFQSTGHPNQYPRGQKHWGKDKQEEQQSLPPKAAYLPSWKLLKLVRSSSTHIIIQMKLMIS
ncbi:hypothetical protein JCGZ_13256 [Jatropha curcas]|uniref:RecQ mediated genome instability protein 1 OB-fold domain-containing protein n=1 Tax=Jatropha curcas TaxID=180498 RepID=A0A067K7X7_JATCU|nr:hypothetical protein JCGZ_13256 [Jatropha curcas]